MRPVRSRGKAEFVRLFLVACTVILGAALAIPDADAARRLGGGKSFGRPAKQAEQPAQREAANPQQAPQPAGAAGGAPSAGSRWMGPLAGIAAGLGLAALLSHLGLIGPFAELLASLLVIGLIVLAGVFVWRMLRGGTGAGRRPLEPVYGGASSRNVPAAVERNVIAARSAAGGSARPGSVAATLGGAGGAAAHAAEPSDTVLRDFDAEAFLRSAKVHFYRLQAAWDQRDLSDLREFTTPEVFAELRAQLAEETAPTANDVSELHAELLGVEETATDWLASVRFHGAIRDTVAGSDERFEEVWNLSKRKDGRSGWLLAGIQQVH